MNKERLKSAFRAAEQNSSFLISIDTEGIPYIEQTSGLKECDFEPFCLSATQWFSVFTLNNLRENKYVTVFIVDARNARFYQIHGLIEEVRNKSFLKGNSEEEQFFSVSRTKRELIIFIKEIYETSAKQELSSIFPFNPS